MPRPKERNMTVIRSFAIEKSLADRLVEEAHSPPSFTAPSWAIAPNVFSIFHLFLLYKRNREESVG